GNEAAVCLVRAFPSSHLAAAGYEDFPAAALPPFRPAAFFWAVVPPCLELLPDPEDFPPRLDAPGELAIRAARCLDMPLSFSASYCFSFLTFGRLFGMCDTSLVDLRPARSVPRPARMQSPRYCSPTRPPRVGEPAHEAAPK